jgi:septal ring factor EnvC (AmiA/AmiB activator)
METRLDRIEKAIEALLFGISELKESQQKTDEQISRIDAQILELKESQKKTDEQMRRTDAKLDRIGKQLADQGLVQGEVAEELFYRNLRSLFRKRNVKFEKVRRNLRRKGEGEYDIVAVNEGKVLVVEVKNKLEKRMVDEFVEERLPRFKELFPEYSRFRVEGGIGALVVKEDVGRYAEKAGLYVLTQTDEGGAALLNRDDFEPKEFS